MISDAMRGRKWMRICVFVCNFNLVIDKTCKNLVLMESDQNEE